MLVTDSGIIVRGPLVNLVAAGAAAAVVVFTIPVLANQLIGTKSVKIKKVQLFNNATGNTSVLIGTGVGVGFLALMPALFSANNLGDVYDDIISAEAFADITAYPAALPLAGSIDIRLEVIVVG